MVTKKPVYLTTDDWAFVIALLRNACPSCGINSMENAKSDVAQRIEDSLFTKRG